MVHLGEVVHHMITTAGVQRHNTMLVAQLFILLHSHQDVNMAF